jgi:hypothetical protein
MQERRDFMQKFREISALFGPMEVVALALFLCTVAVWAATLAVVR